MALSSRKKYTEQHFEELDITPFPKAPGVTEHGEPDDKVDIKLVGWVGEDVMAFTVTNDIQNESSVEIDTDVVNMMDVDVESDLSPIATTTYWTVEMGAGNGKASPWTISYQVKRDGKKTGKWVFVKGKDDDDGKSKPGCLGFLAAMLP